jgi:hypothetical protein
MYTFSILLAPFDDLTLRDVITDIPHDVGAAITYLLLALFVFFTWWGNRPAVMERYSSKHYPRLEDARPGLTAGAPTDASGATTRSPEPAGYAVRSSGAPKKRRA